jgi:hypothetical protein
VVSDLSLLVGRKNIYSGDSAMKQAWDTLWLCQNSYGKWAFVVDYPMKNGDFP